MPFIDAKHLYRKMLETISKSPMQIVTKHKWPVVFVLAGLLVGLSGFTAIQDAHAQFGPLGNLADPAKTNEIHCAQSMTPPGNGTFGGSNAPCIDSGDTKLM